jgi:hypothetical protein
MTPSGSCFQHKRKITALVSLSFLDPEGAARLSEASTTITPQQGITTVRFEDLVPLIEQVYPEDEPASLEAQQSYVLIAQGETTEEALAAAGFVLSVDGPLRCNEQRPNPSFS